MAQFDPQTVICPTPTLSRIAFSQGGIALFVNDVYSEGLLYNFVGQNYALVAKQVMKQILDERN